MLQGTQSNPSAVKCCIWEIRVRKAKYSRFVYSDAYVAIKQTRAVDRNSSSSDALCLPQQLSLISIIKKMPSVCNLVLGAKIVDR